MQRRKTEVDELNMRSFFEEGDLICVGFHHAVVSTRDQRTLTLFASVRLRFSRSLATVRRRYTREIFGTARLVNSIRW